MMRFESELEAYGEELEEFIDMFWLPQGWFGAPDHVAIKCADRSDFERTIRTFEDDAEQISAIDMDGRTLAAVRLASSVAVGSLGDVSWVEVMEPRPEKVGKDVVGLEHMEFTFPDFGLVRDLLSERNIPYEMQSNPSHRWINIVLNELRQELKLNDKPLSEIVEEELASGESYLL